MLYEVLMGVVDKKIVEFSWFETEQNINLIMDRLMENYKYFN